MAHDRVNVILESLEKAEWFSRVGVKDAKGAIVLASWDEAVQHCGSAGWTHLLCNTRIQLRNHKMLMRGGEEHARWTKLEKQAKKLAQPLVKRKTAKVMREHKLPPHFQATVYWNIFRALLEVYYSEQLELVDNPPGFCLNLAYWYARGHFPCDWQGIRVRHRPTNLEPPYEDFYPTKFYTGLRRWYQTGDWGDWRGQIPHGKLIVY
jgi:hypothetical protein